MREKHTSLLYSGLQGLYWGIYCLCYSFAGIFFIANGVSNEWIGLILAGANIVAALAQIGLDAAMTKWPRLGLRKILLVATLLLLLLQGLLILLPLGPLVTVVIFAVSLALILTLQPFINSLGFHYANTGFSLNFGFSRGMGSLTYAVISYIMGQILTVQEPRVIPLGILLVSGLFLADLLLLPADGGELADDDEQKVSILAVFKTYAFLPYTALGTLLIFVFHNALFGFLAQFVGHLGGDSGDVGTVLMLTALTELPAMLLFQRLLKWRSSEFWLTMAALMYFLRGLLTVLAASVLTFELVQVLQGISFALFIPASSYVVNELLKPQDRTLGQTILVVAMTIGGIIGNLLCGWLMDTVSVTASLVVIASSTLLGFGLIFIGMRKTGRGLLMKK